MNFLNPDKIVANFHLEPDMVVADFGCGAGHFSIAMARSVGLEGLVYALDMRAEMLEVLSGYTRMHNMPQIVSIQCDIEEKGGSTLDDNSLDFVLCSSILHQVKNPFAVIEEAARIVRPQGKVAIIDWKAGAVVKLQKIFTKKEALNVFQNTHIEYETDIADVGDHHYGVMGSVTK